jgi:hypothetical protein
MSLTLRQSYVIVTGKRRCRRPPLSVLPHNEEVFGTFCRFYQQPASTNKDRKDVTQQLPVLQKGKCLRDMPEREDVRL